MNQVAVLLVFPAGVSKERANQLVVQFMDDVKRNDETPEIVEIREIDDRTGPVIYQP